MRDIDLDLVRMPMWTVYEGPSDYPDHWVARLWYSLPDPTPTDAVIIADSFAALKKKIPGMETGRWHFLMRLGDDDPNIAGVFV
jgi:hypothetical protein